MKLVGQKDYRSHTLLEFEERHPKKGATPRTHWMVISPNGVNVASVPLPSQDAAQQLVDRIVGPDTADER